MKVLVLFQDAAAGPCRAQIKPEPGDDVEIRSFPLLKKLSVKLTDCRVWLEGRDFLSLGEASVGSVWFWF